MTRNSESSHSLKKIRRAVSRTFDISMRLLPRAMQEPISIAYLLARSSDTLADTDRAPENLRLTCLRGFSDELFHGKMAWRSNLPSFIEQQRHRGEIELLRSLDECFRHLNRQKEEVRELIRAVLKTIIQGQEADLLRIQNRDRIKNDEELHQYCHQVAGCVGIFWTKIGFATLGHDFSDADPAELEYKGECYGRGLQLVNILRDAVADAQAGRIYLPEIEISREETFLSVIERLLPIARANLREGQDYADHIKGRRVQAATRLPALLGEKTLDLLEKASWGDLKVGVKIDKNTVINCAFKAVLRSFAAGIA